MEDARIGSRFALAALALAAVLGGAALGQGGRASGETEAQFLGGGFGERECTYPKKARAVQLSGCCEMELEIGSQGEVLKAEGTCSDPVFLEPTRRCLSVQRFVPATRNGQPVQARQHLEYEWRATIPSKTNLCKPLRTS